MEQEAPQPKYQEVFIDVAGARVHYLHAGNGKPIVLIHGLVGASENWRNNIDALARDASVYAIDLVNMGKSQRVGGPDAGLSATPNASSQSWTRSISPKPTSSAIRMGEPSR